MDHKSFSFVSSLFFLEKNIQFEQNIPENIPKSNEIVLIRNRNKTCVFVPASCCLLPNMRLTDPCNVVSKVFLETIDPVNRLERYLRRNNNKV